MAEREEEIVALVPLWAGVDYGAAFGGTTVLGHTLMRLGRVEGLGKIVLLLDEGVEGPTDLGELLGEKLVVHRVAEGLSDRGRAARVAGRKFSPRAWRGGLGGATIWDEVLAAKAMVEGLEAVEGEFGLIVGGDWSLVDPVMCGDLIERHRSEPTQLKLVFNQAPPGLCGCLVGKSLLEELAESGGTIGGLLDYQPRLPQGDPIGKSPCVQIAAEVRDAGVRVTCDWDRYARRVIGMADEMEAGALLNLDAAGVVAKLKEGASDGVGDRGGEWCNEVTVEVTTKRTAHGPLAVTAADVGVERTEMSVETARAVFDQIAKEGGGGDRGGDVVVTLGGLGDPLLHAEWEAIVMAAAEAGVYGIHIRTDLLVDEEVLAKLIRLPVDVVSVNVNADCKETYEAVMGVDGYAQVIKNLEWILNNRNKEGEAGMPWLSPRFAKTEANIEELEDFFDRWTHYAGHAVVESPRTGCGAVKDWGVMPMEPPMRFACRQLGRRMTVHCDGVVARCGEDWKGAGSLGEAKDMAGAWAAGRLIYGEQKSGEYGGGGGICKGCCEWHRP